VLDVTMRLMLLRHAKSEKGEPGLSDRDRTLNARGRLDAPKLGAYMAHHALRPDRAMVSDSRRTRETWERLCKAWTVPPPASFESGLYNTGPDAILHLLREDAEAPNTLLLVGHNPGLHELGKLLIASGDVDARERLNEGLPTSGLLVIDFVGSDWSTLHPRSGRLERFITPRLLRSDAD
jgi:phosphohistidine phosphatase